MYHFTFLPVFLLAIQLASAASDWSFSNWNGYTSTSWPKEWNVVQWSYPHNMNDVSIVSDPISKQNQVLRILYPKGSYNPSGSKIGGAGFYAKPIHIPVDTRTITLTYQVLFPQGFDFNRGKSSNIKKILATSLQTLNRCTRWKAAWPLWRSLGLQWR